jgi:hypothetical protein
VGRLVSRLALRFSIPKELLQNKKTPARLAFFYALKSTIQS